MDLIDWLALLAYVFMIFDTIPYAYKRFSGALAKIGPLTTDDRVASLFMAVLLSSIWIIYLPLSWVWRKTLPSILSVLKRWERNHG